MFLTLSLVLEVIVPNFYDLFGNFPWGRMTAELTASGVHQLFMAPINWIIHDTLLLIEAIGGEILMRPIKQVICIDVELSASMQGCVCQAMRV
jgi:hypothetical protein